MCARRFLIAVTILTLIVVAAAFAIFQFGGSVLRDSFTPQGGFEAPEPRSGPDYALAGSWLARPGLADNPADWLPEGAQRGSGDAAVFYIHPTTYLRGDRWNAPLSEIESDSRSGLFLRSQASAFSGSGEIWAPRYRQAAYGAFLLDSMDAQKALDLAYSDVAAAFAAFLEQTPEDRPVILAGHSQGALHLIRLLRENHREIADRLVAAYAVGWPIDRRADLPALGFPACADSGDSRCILSWMTFGDPPNPDLILDGWESADGLAGGNRDPGQILCVNPISGRIGDSAPASANPGTLVPTPDFAGATLVGGMLGARCENGLLIVEGSLPPLGPFVLPGNNYHVYDYALFWGAVREDARRRLESWHR